MLFNSHAFVFIFLPIAVGVFFGISKLSNSKTCFPKTWLIAVSLFFYGWWEPRNLFLIAFSIFFNYELCLYLRSVKTASLSTKKCLLVFGIIVNLGLLGYFKYLNFLSNNLNALIGTDFEAGNIILPLAISFFTFQQIAYLIETYRGEIEDRSFLNYTLFVVFFPQLIAGPIVHFKDVINQFRSKSIYQFDSTCFSVGTFIFFVGLFKKTVLADRIAIYVGPVFETASQGIQLSFFEAWVGALSYTMQLYFDFSGYSDMAIGIALLFGIRLPINFDSPYKATSIIDFWRRWHITLSNFLRDYLYIPLGGNRKGDIRKYGNLLLTMLLGGLWHGAGWTFVLWGGLHGVFLVINNCWETLIKSSRVHPPRIGQIDAIVSWFITFLAVVVSWVFFRASTVKAALQITGSMFGIQGISLPNQLADYFGFLTFLEPFGVRFQGLQRTLSFSIVESVISLLVLMGIAFLLPNTQQWLGKYKLADTQSFWLDKFWHRLYWRPNLFWGCVSAFVSFIALLHMSRVSEFLYFQF